MTDIDSKDSISADTNGLGSVVVQIHGEGKVIYMTADESRQLAAQLLAKASDAEFQNTVL